MRVEETISSNRREFIKAATGAALFGNAFLAMRSPVHAAETLKRRKTVVVTFGGGARDEETFMPEGQQNVPHLLHALVPRATFYSQVVNRGILGHYVATASLATGVYETFNNFAAVSPGNPTIFEYFRHDLRRPASDAWVVAPSNGFNLIGSSNRTGYGQAFGAGVILPKHLLSSSLLGGKTEQYDHLLRDNYETHSRVELPPNDLTERQMSDVLKLSMSEFTAHARTVTSPDELSLYVARQLMRTTAPSLLWITLHDIDIAHSGTYSLYLEAIQRSDRLCGEIWNTIQSEPEYAGNTNLFILPDFGRDSDLEAGGNGFQHHRTGDALSRTTWMMALGPGIRENVVVDHPVESVDLVPTIGRMAGFMPRFSQGKILTEIAG